MTREEFNEFIADTSKRIDGDITWGPDEDHSPAIEFRADLQTDAGHPAFIRGSVNRRAGTLSLAIIHRAYGRIYGLDLGKDHRNPDGTMVGEKHKHEWRDGVMAAKFAYEPLDITAQLPDVALVWQQFCEEARIEHRGRLVTPSDFNQPELFE